MLKHYLRYAWRALRRQKGYSFIHVLGLSIGLCTCIVIFLIARFDLGFDTFHPDADRIYRIVGDVQLQKGFNMFLNTPFPQAAGIEHDIPGFEKQVGFHTFGSTVTIPAEKGRAEANFATRPDNRWGTNTILTGPAFFDLFPHKWLTGNPTVLIQPNRIVLAQSAARKYFGNATPGDYLGKTVIVDDSLPLTVAGIVDDWNKLSDLDYTSFISISTAPNSWVKTRFPTTDWHSLQPHQSQAFVKLAKGVQPEQVNAALAEYIRRNNPQFTKNSRDLHLYLQPLRKMHYSSTFKPVDTGDDFRTAYLPLLYGLMGIAGFILLLAIINFINLSSAQSLQRIKEIGIRKVMGSSRKGLIAQFLIETLLVTTVAVALSALLVRPALWLFRDYIPYGVSFVFDGKTLGFLMAIVGTTTLAAGFYPAWLLSSYLPALSLKGALDRVGMRGAGFRKALIVFQFSISLLFIIGSLVIGRQMTYMRDADKGFSSDAILTLNPWPAKPEQVRLLAQRLRSITGVADVILQGNAPMGHAHAMASLTYKANDAGPTPVMIQHAAPGLISFYGMKLLAGRDLHPGDTVQELVINETYARQLGFTDMQNALGKLLYRNDTIPYSVVGVVADFHQESFHEQIKPLVIWNFVKAERSLGVKLATRGKSGKEAKAILMAMESRWKEVFPKIAFNYSFLNESITQLYDSETNTAFLMQAATAITIVISCLGLFGLALFTARRREKEVGIRKVLGASVTSVAVLLSRQFIILVTIALAIASPIAWYLADTWLKDFAYRTSMDVGVLIEAGAAGIVLTILTVGLLAVRAARKNPAAVLKQE
jgi:putative ABC transport system permease protein